VHERESQLAVFERDGRLLNEGRKEERIPTRDLKNFINSIPGEKKHVAVKSFCR
jgi:hypothetical protein